MSSTYLHAVIHVISKSELGYQGVLTEVDPVKSTLTLSNVRFLGTEGRQPGMDIPASPDVYPSILFQGSDVKSLSIVSFPPAHAPAAPAAPAPTAAAAAPVAPPPAQTRSVFDAAPNAEQGVAAVTVLGLAPGSNSAMVESLFSDAAVRAKILSIRILALPASAAASQPGMGRYAADVVFSTADAARAAMACFQQKEGLSIEFLQAKPQPQQQYTRARPPYYRGGGGGRGGAGNALESSRNGFDRNTRGGGGPFDHYRGRGGGGGDLRSKNVETFGDVALSHRGGSGNGRGGTSSRRGGPRGGAGRGNANRTQES